MKNSIHQRVLETIARHAMIRPGDRVGIGVSGGADSTAMLRLLADLRERLGIAIFVLHFHHQLRGAEADEDERFVQALAGEFGFVSETGRADVAGEAKQHGWNLEDAARRLRYQFFDATAKARGLQRVAVAHTADDQAETVLAHLLRGTGMTGLAGIYPVAGLIVRPLIELRREELRRYLSDLGQPWREDGTNQDTSRMRARIRHQLIPLLHRDFDSAVVARLARVAAHAREDEVFWRALEVERLRALAAPESAGNISVSIADLMSPFPGMPSRSRHEEPESELASAPSLVLTRRLVRRIYSDLRGSREELTARHVEAVLDLATKSQSGARIELPGVRVERVFDRLIFSSVPHAPDVSRQSHSEWQSGGFTYELPRLGRFESASVVVTQIQKRFSLKVVDWPPGPSDTRISGILDFERVHWPLVLRNWRPGDSFRPHGSRRVQKLKRLFLESRVPRKAREGWPVLTSEDRVIWACGFPEAKELAPHKGTRTALVISEEEI
jgi:tRNA(Ile)-lysidine synthase